MKPATLQKQPAQPHLPTPQEQKPPSRGDGKRACLSAKATAAARQMGCFASGMIGHFLTNRSNPRTARPGMESAVGFAQKLWTTAAWRDGRPKPGKHVTAPTDKRTARSALQMAKKPTHRRKEWLKMLFLYNGGG